MFVDDCDGRETCRSGMSGSAFNQSSVVGDGGVSLVGEVVVVEPVAAGVVALNLE